MTISLLIADPSASAIGYVILFAFCAIVFFFVILAVPSLRKYRRKRNRIIYAAMGIILSSLLVQAYEVSLRPPLFTVSTIDPHKNVNSSESIFLKANQINQVNFTCTTYCGDISASFYLVFKGANISFIGNQPDYLLTDTATIKIPFAASIGRGLQDIKNISILFEISQNVTRFQLYPSIEEISGRVLWGSAYWDIWADYNSTEQSYRLIEQRICL